ncbi:HTH-type transcriptional regulator MetR [Paraconexibacter sp. AEG42_29]|uniref:HTH-type transcriptional regulator MetR n=1 Tax=Paraconexibacter sp. AEG42_29 TaxID=2997339 RepID=A0AAU7APS4_9ACTN
MLDLGRLRMLRELEAVGTVAGTAAALGYTPSAVSQQLAVLEREAGARLLAKAGRGVRLTDAGRLLARHAGILLAAAEEAEADLQRAAHTVAGTIRIAGFQTAMLQVVIPASAAVGRAHPDVHVELVEAEVEEALPGLRRGRLDVLIQDEYDGLPRERHADLHRETLLREEVRLILPAGHPLARTRRRPSLAAFAGETWCAAQPGTAHHAMVLGTCRALGGFEPTVRHTTNDLLVLLELVRTIGAITLLPDLIRTGNDTSVVARTPAEGAIRRDVQALTRRTGAHRPALVAVREALVTAAHAAAGSPGRAATARRGP